jgi:hypothetical protein
VCRAGKNSGDAHRPRESELCLALPAPLLSCSGAAASLGQATSRDKRGIGSGREKKGSFKREHTL